jgi:hypothetical protein
MKDSACYGFEDPMEEGEQPNPLGMVVKNE